MKLIEHPNIMHLYDVWETSTELYLILEYVEGGELFDYLCKRGRLSTPEALGYFQQIIAAIDYCHRFNIAHRDLKPENLLLDQDKNIKVADFGMAAWQMNNTSGLLRTACGSPHYAAPEVIEGRAYNGSSSDIWSCGVILFALLAGRLPFDDEDLHTLLEKVKIGSYDMPQSIDKHAQDLITRMLEKDVRKRITIEQILVHPFFTLHPPKNPMLVPPSLVTIARPIQSPGDIDPDILANLRTLWHGTPEEEIIKKLTNSEQTWEKGVYYLLQQYRIKHLEEYDEKVEELYLQAARNRKKPVATLVTDQVYVPPRIDPPTPRRARGRASPGSPSDNEGALTPGLLTPQYFYSPALPSVAPTPTRSNFSTLATPLSPNFPQTPNTLISPNTNPLSPDSPLWSTLNMSPPPDVPELQDEKVQQFFQQIVEHLNVMQQHAAAAGLNPSVLSPYSAQPQKPEGLGILGSETTETANSTITKPLSIRRTLRKPAPLQLKADKEKENAGDESQRAGMAYKSSMKSKNPVRRVLIDRRVQIVEPHNPLKPKKSTGTAGTNESSANDPPHQASPLTPTWFGNLFKLKPMCFSLLSVHDPHTSREECKRILYGLGVRAVLIHADDMGILKCRLDETSGPAGVMGVVKAVRFRVEVHSANEAQEDAGYQTVLQMVHEKGAVASFRLVYTRLRREWDLDAPKIPLPTPSPALTDGSGRFADLLYG
ncbi:kinase-like domain-containing protein [Multifurca ochricompacta]|uniref:Kinase-like domain-containing protein n=1 Tax=Multifurca ochricompacta TaxID=376703 RepID=A0AAD4QIA7_9AGAM|nr:kinase-like domain-containing protein [Multifurca ochricompacta]